MAKKNSVKSMLVIGMGRFGRYLATKLLELGNDVMIVDQDEKIIDELAPMFTNASIGDCTNGIVLKSIGVDHFDVCFVAIDENFQASLEITSLLYELNAKKIVSKASRGTQAKFLLQVGATEVVYPEKDNAERLAIKYSVNNVFDYIQLTPEYSLFEIPIKEEWEGKSIIDIDVRKNYDINILGVKRESELIPSPAPSFVFEAGDHIVTIGHVDAVMKLAEKIN